MKPREMNPGRRLLSPNQRHARLALPVSIDCIPKTVPAHHLKTFWKKEMSQMLEETDTVPPPAVELPTYIVEVAKSGRAECKKCDCKIENKCLRIGVIVDGEWGLFTRWQHLDCTVFHKEIASVEELDGYSDLTAQQKELVKERFVVSADEVDEDMQPIDPDELVRKAWEKPLEPSANLLMPLLPYQKEGLGWMVNQELNDVHGGILADEMGMGKTIQAIALMLQNRPDMSDFSQLREWAASDARHAAPNSAIASVSTSSSSSSAEASSEELVRCGTLIVLPTVAIRQWQTEIARFTKEGSLTVKVYHGSDRNTSALDLTKTDIVLTSYKILEIEYRKATAGTKVTCRVCQKKFYPDKLRVHRKYFCGESAQRTEAQALTQKKKARTGSANTASATRPGASTSTPKNNRKRPRNAFGVPDACEEEGEGEEMSEDGDEDEGQKSVNKRPRGGKSSASTSNSRGMGSKTAGVAAKKAAKSQIKRRGKGKGKAIDDGSDSGSDSGSSPHSSDEEEEEETEAKGVKVKGKSSRKSNAAVSAKKPSASASVSPSVGKNKKSTVKIKSEPDEPADVLIKAEPGTETSATAAAKKGNSKPAKTAVPAAAVAPTKSKRGAVQKKAAAAVVVMGAEYWPDIDAPDSPTSSGSEDNYGPAATGDADHGGGISSGSDIDAPPPSASRRPPNGQRSTAPAPVTASVTARGRTAAPRSGTKAADSALPAACGESATAATSHVPTTPSLRAPTRRAAALGQKKYTDDTRDSDFDTASSTSEKEEQAVKKGRSSISRSVKLMLAAEEEEMDVDSEFEVEEEGEEEKPDSSGSDRDDDNNNSDAPTDSGSERETRVVVKGRGGRGSSNNSRSKSAPPARRPAGGGRGRASPAAASAVKVKSASIKSTSVGNGEGRVSAVSNNKKAAVGKKRPAPGAARTAKNKSKNKTEDSDDDVAWESASNNSTADSANNSDNSDSDTNSDTNSDARKAKGGKSDDSEVERDIQQALLEAAAAQRRSKQGAAVSVLHLVSWFRIILDEAHLIKDRSTSTAKAVFNLTSLNKWCLTGTPLQNRVGELYSLIRFLRVDPHAFYYCRTKGCCCKSLHYRFTKSYCDECHHSVIQHYCHFNKHILNPIKRSGYVADGRRAMLKLKQQVLDEILLRRTKTTRAEDIQLPPRIVTVRSEKLDVKEEDFYSALYTQSQAQFNTYLQSGTVLNNYAHIFDILIRLRQAVDHPYLVIYSEAQVAKIDDSENYLNLSTAGNSDTAVTIKAEPGSSPSSNNNNNSTDSCDLCHEPCEDPVCSASCGHTFCRLCITDYINSMSNSNSNSNGNNGSSGLRCPDCDQPLTIQLLLPPSSSAPSSSSTSISSRAAAAAVGGRRSSGGDQNNANAVPGIEDQQRQQQQQQQNSVSVWDAAKGLSRKSILDKVDLNSFQSSTKIEALMEELYKMQSEDLGAKAIVFSQFVNMLDLISFRLQRGGLQCVKLSGSMTLEQRDKCITAFKADPDVKVMLISLKAGGVALNLTVASRIFLMDPWWNPAAEMQAIDRTHRIGQHKPIYATRFIIENTIEERILRLQEKKKLVFDGTVGGDSSSMSKLTVDDMRFLFN